MTATMAAVIKVIYPTMTGTKVVVRFEAAVKNDGKENIKRNQESITGAAKTNITADADHTKTMAGTHLLEDTTNTTTMVVIETRRKTEMGTGKKGERLVRSPTIDGTIIKKLRAKLKLEQATTT
jgi:hypothetical protein